MWKTALLYKCETTLILCTRLWKPSYNYLQFVNVLWSTWSSWAVPCLTYHPIRIPPENERIPGSNCFSKCCVRSAANFLLKTYRCKYLFTWSLHWCSISDTSRLLVIPQECIKCAQRHILIIALCHCTRYQPANLFLEMLHLAANNVFRCF